MPQLVRVRRAGLDHVVVAWWNPETEQWVANTGMEIPPTWEATCKN